MYKVLKQQLENTHLDMATISFYVEKLLFCFRRGFKAQQGFLRFPVPLYQPCDWNWKG